jgi:hypothetical protein
MTYLEHLYCKLNNRQTVQVCVDNQVGNISVDEKLTRQKADDLIGRDAAVRASDPKVIRRLLMRECREEVRIAGVDAVSPSTVVLEKDI